MPYGLEPPYSGGAYVPEDMGASPYVKEDSQGFDPMSAYTGGVLPETAYAPPPEPIIEYIPADPPDPSPEFQKKAYEYVTEFCRASAEFMKPHIARAERNWLWYRGKLRRQDLDADRATTKGATVSRADKEIDPDEDVDENDFLYPIQPIIDSIRAYVNISIFSGPEYLTLSNEDDQGENGAEDLTRQNEAIKRLLLKKLRQGRFKTNISNLLTDQLVTGNAIPITTYYEHKVRKWRELVIDGEPTGEVEEYEETVYECPITQGVKITRFLPDPKATTTDTNRWRGFGHIIPKTYDECIQEFNKGYYHLNRKEFEKRFKDLGGSIANTGESPIESEYGDSRQDINEEKVSDLMLIEWQGRIPDDKRGMIESHIIIAYEPADHRQEYSFKSGLLLRFKQQTISESGLRNTTIGHWVPGNGPIGLGLPDTHEDLLYLASQFIAQIHDAASYSVTGAYIGSNTDEKLKSELATDPRIKNGRVILTDEKDSLRAAPHPDTADIGKLQAIVQQLLAVVERSAGSEEPTQDIASDMKATVFSGLQQRSQAPATVRTQAFAEECITPAANLSLSFLQSMTFEDQPVKVPDADTGTDVTMMVTRDDLRRGKWVVEASITNMDNTQLAAANIVKDLLMQAPMIKELLREDNKDLSVAELMNILLTATKTPNANRLIRTLGPREQVLIQQIQQLQTQIEEMQAAAQGGQQRQQPSGEAQGPPNLGNTPEGFGMGGGPKGPEPTDDNVMMLMTQLDAANRQGMPL